VFIVVLVRGYSYFLAHMRHGTGPDGYSCPCKNYSPK
jgi:hypothetical protein